MNPNLAVVIFGLAASLCWGSGDFYGGLASRRANSSSVVFVAYLIGFVVLVSLALIWREALPIPADLMWGALGGLTGAIGLMFFYSALSVGQMGITAPVSAVLTAGIPVLFSSFTSGFPGWAQLGGFILALLAIVLISRPERAKGRPKGIGLALFAGCGFGSFFVIISFVSDNAVFWPLATARLTSVFFLLAMMHIRRQQILPDLAVAPQIVLAGVLDAVGNAFYILASHTARLDVAAMLSSLYPATTVLLAAIILRERMTRIQGMGVVLALIAVPLIAMPESFSLIEVLPFLAP